MSEFLIVPQANPNDTHARLVSWHMAEGKKIAKGALLCTIETSKAAVELEAPAAGYWVPLAKLQERVAIGAPLAAIVKKQSEMDAKALLAEWKKHSGGKASGAAKNPWTKKAALVARRHGLDIAALAAQHPGKTLQEADVLAAVPGGEPSGGKPQGQAYSIHRPERIILLGGGAGAGQIAMDAIARTAHQEVVGILDNNKELHGQDIKGVPVLGGMDEAARLWKEGACDGMVIVFTGDLAAREQLFKELKRKKVRFSNIIDPSVILRPSLHIGEGNMIMGHSYLAANIRIGDNNFMASHTCIEHHSSVGSHCSFGPRSTASGAVTIGDGVKFGMHVAVEPYLQIGDGAVIASGCVITGNIPPGATVKAQQGYMIREGE